MPQKFDKTEDCCHECTESDRVRDLVKGNCFLALFLSAEMFLISLCYMRMMDDAWPWLLFTDHIANECKKEIKKERLKKKKTYKI